MTWGSFFTRSISFVVVLPLLLRKLPAEEIVVWYLFMTITSLQFMMDIGFGSTTSRAISYAMGGATDVRGFHAESEEFGDKHPNWPLLGKVISNMKTVYTLLALVVLIVAGILGTWALMKPIAQIHDQTSVWLAWLLILLFYPINMRTSIYGLYLEGINQVALVRRWDIFTSLGSIISFFLILFLGGGILSLVIANQTWGFFRILRNWMLCRHVEEGRFKSFRKEPFDKELFASLWPSTWRSGVGAFMSYGLISVSSMLIAQVGDTAQTASYLLAMRLMDTVDQFSQGPFYSKLPLLARKRAEGDITGLISIAQRGMAIGFWAFVSGFIFLALFAQPLLTFVKSNASFASPDLWLLIGIAFFIHRYGAMHIQLYSTTNHIIWHIADTVSGTVFIVVSLTLLSHMGVYAFPVAMICGWLGFYSWFAAGYSYRAMNTSFWRFERLTLIPPIIVLSLYSGIVLWSIYV